MRDVGRCKIELLLTTSFLALRCTMKDLNEYGLDIFQECSELSTNWIRRSQILGKPDSIQPPDYFNLNWMVAICML